MTDTIDAKRPEPEQVTRRRVAAAQILVKLADQGVTTVTPEIIKLAKSRPNLTRRAS